MKLNVGDYVRTKEFGINRVKWFDNEEPILENGFTALQSSGYKSSPNIIDILEEHDFVRMEDRGIRFYEIEKDYQGKLSLRDIGWDEYEELDETNIPEIVSVITHEQMEQMQYKVQD